MKTIVARSEVQVSANTILAEADPDYAAEGIAPTGGFTLPARLQWTSAKGALNDRVRGMDLEFWIRDGSGAPAPLHTTDPEDDPPLAVDIELLKLDRNGTATASGLVENVTPRSGPYRFAPVPDGRYFVRVAAIRGTAAGSFTTWGLNVTPL